MAAIFGLFAAVENGRWSWGLGDPDLGAVLVTGLYFLVAGICLVVGRRRRRKADPLDPLIRPAAAFSPGADAVWAEGAAVGGAALAKSPL